MSVKIFIPLNFSDFKYFYGYKERKEETKSYYIIKCTNQSVKSEKLTLIGVLDEVEESRDCFKLICKKREIVSIQNINSKNILVFYYDPKTFNDFNASDYEMASLQTNSMLYLANHQDYQENHSIHHRTSLLLFKALISFSNFMSIILQPIAMFFQKTAIYRHSKIWKNSLTEKRLRDGSIVLDIILGILLCLILNHLRHPENYFMSITEFVLEKLRMLLNELDGSPAGLKLNVQLNNFLHSCFVYHVDLWWNFISIVEPAISYFFVPITIFGLMGFSFQCAMFCDIITLITLHAHCFYIYAAMLYKLELTSLRSLWRMVLGRRLNVLKNRVESQEYSNRQLFLATLFFTTLLFLFPTIITYYVVFASLRLLIYCITYLLMSLQRKILMFPFYKYIKWIFGLHTDITNVSFDLTSQKNFNGNQLLQFRLTHLKSAPWKSSPFIKKCKDEFSKPLPIDVFAKNLIKGELMAFIPNE